MSPGAMHMLVDSDTTGYDELGNVTLTADANCQVTSYQYDELSRVTRVTYPDGRTVDYTYYPAGNLLFMTPTAGSFTATIARSLTSVTYSPTSSPSDPDADDRLRIRPSPTASTALVPSGKRVQYGYDNAWRKLTSVTEKNAGQPDLATTVAICHHLVCSPRSRGPTTPRAPTPMIPTAG